MSRPEKIVMVGDQLTSDIMFGNLNNMPTIWVNKFRDFFAKDEFKVEGFKEGMAEAITKDGMNEVFQLELLKANQMIKEESLTHPTLGNIQEKWV